VAFKSGLAAGVKGSLKGWAADVEVALGGVCEEVESPWRAADCVAVAPEMGVALWRGGEVVRKRAGVCGRIDDRGRGIWWAVLRLAARRQDRHIIFSGARCGNCPASILRSRPVIPLPVQKFETGREGCRWVSPTPMGPALGGAVHRYWSLGLLPRPSPTLRDVFPLMDLSEAHMLRFSIYLDFGRW
jgi:hypothetical protein